MLMWGENLFNCTVVQADGPDRPQGSALSCAGHHMLPCLIGNACRAESQALMDRMLLLFHNHELEAGDTIMMAFEQGSLTKANSFKTLFFTEEIKGVTSRQVRHGCELKATMPS